MKKKYLIFLLYITMQAQGGFDPLNSRLETGGFWEDVMKRNMGKTNIVKGSFFIGSSMPLVILSGVSFSLALKNLKLARQLSCSDQLATAACNLVSGYIAGGAGLGIGLVGYRFLNEK